MTRAALFLFLTAVQACRQCHSIPADLLPLVVILHVVRVCHQTLYCVEYITTCWHCIVTLRTCDRLFASTLEHCDYH